MADGLRERRIRQEAERLRELAVLNPGRLRLLDEFTVELRTAAYAPEPGDWPVRLRLEFAPYYPSVPIEVFAETPRVLHPNAHPENGFLCLWDHHSPGDTVVEALRQTQRVLSAELKNAHADHLMQPEALHLPALPYHPLELPAGYLLEREARAFGTRTVRRRLSAVE